MSLTTSTMPTQIRFIKLDNWQNSDGSLDQKPSASTHKFYNPPIIYLQKLGTSWMKHRGEAMPGIVYQLDRLPAGYTVWEKERANNPGHTDRWCYGHPSGKNFDSPNRFLPHFLTLMEGEDDSACTCINCAKGNQTKGKAPVLSSNFRAAPHPEVRIGRPPGRPPGRPVQNLFPTETTPTTAAATAGVYKAKGRQWVEGRTDAEGTPDPYRNFIDKLKVSDSLDSEIRENMSMDWRAERQSNIESYLKKQQKSPSWVPRRMEIVLFVRALQPEESLMFDKAKKRFSILNDNDSTLKEPLWEVGVITQTPIENCTIEDILFETTKTHSVTSSGFRIEPLSNANSKEGKGIWKQYTYLRLHQIRPFNMWRNFLSGTLNSKWHPTITNAMTVMSTIALVQKYRFRGKWPSARVYCRAMYLGAELIQEGDFVYLTPEDDSVSEVHDILHIKTITLDLWNLDKASSDDYDDGHPYNCAVRVTGTVYTNTKDRAYDSENADSLLEGTGLNLFGPWYVHTPYGKLSRLPFHRVLGRCYDPTAVDLWIHGEKRDGRPLTSPGPGLKGVFLGRKYSSNNYRRIKEGRNWFWGDSRVDALDLEEVNGWVVSSQDAERDPKLWRKEIRVMDGTARPEERLALHQAMARASARISTHGMGGAINVDAIDSVETSRDRKRSRSAMGRSDEEESGEEEDEGTAQNRFVDQMAQGLGMEDEEVPSSDEEDDGGDARMHGRGRGMHDGEHARMPERGRGFHDVSVRGPKTPMVIIG